MQIFLFFYKKTTVTLTEDRLATTDRPSFGLTDITTLECPYKKPFIRQKMRIFWALSHAAYITVYQLIISILENVWSRTL